MKNEQVMIVNDIAGVGKVAANVLYPIFSAAQFEPTILPTLLLSSNIGVSDVITKNTDDIFSDYLDIWNELDYQFDSYVTGYFANTNQISEFKNYYLDKKEKDSTVALFVDPTMGGSGRLYKGFDEKVPSHIGQLIEKADLVKPNITEACLITGHPYKENMGIDELIELAKEVNQMGAKNTVLTGIRRKNAQGEEQIGFLYYDENNNSDMIFHTYFDKHFFGTGDLVFSLMTIFYLNNHSLHSALENTAALTEKALQNTLDLNRGYKYGVFFESIFPELIEQLQLSINK